MYNTLLFYVFVFRIKQGFNLYFLRSSHSLKIKKPCGIISITMNLQISSVSNPFSSPVLLQCILSFLSSTARFPDLNPIFATLCYSVRLSFLICEKGNSLYLPPMGSVRATEETEARS